MIMCASLSAFSAPNDTITFNAQTISNIVEVKGYGPHDGAYFNFRTANGKSELGRMSAKAFENFRKVAATKNLTLKATELKSGYYRVELIKEPKTAKK